VVEDSKISRLCQLAKDARITVCVDCAENIAALSRAAVAADATLYCLVEYDIGLMRCGVLTHGEVIELARAVDAADGLVFDGIQAYAGQLSHETDADKRTRETEARAKDLRALLSELEAAGLSARVLSGGSTGTSAIKAKEGLYTELQAGSYLFMDSTYAELDLGFENSLYLLTTVLSVKDGLVVVDAGVKSCGVDQGMPRIHQGSAKEISACEEHFQIFSPDKKYNVGDKILLIPAHCCSTVNLHDRIYLVNNGRVVSRIAVSARGCSK
jgi:3-hydroxy-D-aspartate aldolase